MFPNVACQWIPVALSTDVPPATVVPAWIPGLELALWRSTSGQLAASNNRCPHRGMRLTHGFVRGENLACIYHGWSYGIKGICVRIPAHPDMTPPATIKSQNKSVAEVGGIIWVCEGHSKSAPPEIKGLAPLRTLTFDVSSDALESFTETTKNDAGLCVALVNGEKLRLVLAPLPEQKTLVHALVDSNATHRQRIEASRAAEAFRLLVEANQAGQAVA
jgi:phenylpropionate dioxygenase-like ring-hydroxylating dioxygenase large terminal subunit